MELPIHLQQIEVNDINCFQFVIPERDLGVSDVSITVEYGTSRNDSNKTSYNAWAQIGTSLIRGIVYVGQITSQDDVKQSIIMDISSSQDFFDKLHEFMDLMLQDK